LYQTLVVQFGLVAMPNWGGGSFGAGLNLIEPNDGSSYGDYEVMTGGFSCDGAPDILVAPDSKLNPSVFYLNQGGDNLSFSATPASVHQGDQVVLRATLSVLQGTATPTGTVTFSSNSTAIGTADLSGGTVAELILSMLPVGTDAITAVYGGDSNHNPATASTVSATVQALAPNFSFTSSSRTLPLSAGQTGTLSLTVTANEAFSGQISFACTGLPSGASCAFTPTTVTLSSGGRARSALPFPRKVKPRQATKDRGRLGLG
jgi:Bacterial Ig-like domain (group 3)